MYKTAEEEQDDNEIAAEARLRDRDAAPSKRGTLDGFLKKNDRCVDNWQTKYHMQIIDFNDLMSKSFSRIVAE